MADAAHDDELQDEDEALGRLLTAYLATRNVPCPKCRYNLRGVTSGFCPECGEEIVITVGHVDQSSMPWIIAMALYALAVMFSGMGALTVSMAIISGSIRAADLAALAASGAAFTAAIVGLALLIWRRERIWACSLFMQCAIVLSVLLVPLSALAVFALAMLVLA